VTGFDQTTVTFDPSDQTSANVELDASWSSLRGVHGGYLSALTVRAAEAHLDGRPVRTVSVSFLRPAAVGAATLTVEPVRLGRSLSTIDVTVTQRQRRIAVARITASASVDGEHWDTAARLPLPPREGCVWVEPPPDVRHFEHADALLDPAHLPFSHGPRARVAGYVRPRNASHLDAAWLTTILDWFPPSPFTRHDPPTGGVSVDYVVHVHRTVDHLGETDWLAGTFHADVSNGGLTLEHGALYDPAGRVLAESFHTRWTG
jgi:acyl-CoA thioesterase